MRTRLVCLTPCLTLIAVCSAHCGEDTYRTPGTTRDELRPGLADSGVSADAAAPPPPMPDLSCGAVLEGSTCDPVTAWPCDTARGETCDYSNTAGAFRCFPGPNDVPFCGACNTSDAFCGAGLLCDIFIGCERFCCQDSDCKIGRCTPNVYGDDAFASVGHCHEELLAGCGPADRQPLDGGSSDGGLDASRDSGI